MPHATMAEDEVPALKVVANALEDVLHSASKAKPIGDIEPALTPENLPELDRRFGTNREEMSKLLGFQEHNIFEVACRRIFIQTLTSARIGEPTFGTVWNLIDIVVTLGDRDQCASQLAFWLIEEIFESHTIEDCKKVFDYLESRREWMVPANFEKKNQVILRGCNELLRRLSHGEDTLFYGRVLIYLFRAFPLCHRSAINLRGEFHVDNTTVYDRLPVKAPQADIMEVDVVNRTEAKQEVTGETKITITPAEQNAADTTGGKATAEAKEEEAEKTLDLDDLYSVFWSLQNYFSRPTQLFDPSNLKHFKEGLQATIAKFQEIQRDQDSRASVKASEEPKQGTKRKWEAEEETLIGEINPKYLTSRDLFALELSDLAFRRHILVQSLIIIEFLLSLTPKGKAKVASLTRKKGVVYNFVLPDEEALWAQATKTSIASYLQSGTEGKFYYRMIDTVLARDKNWTFWKAENCPKFPRPTVSATDFLSAAASAHSTTTTKRLKATAMNAFDISFLADADGSRMLEKLRDPARARHPPLESFEKEIANKELDVDFAEEGSKEREDLEEQRRSLVWRSLRIGVKDRLKRFEKVDDGRKVEALFKEEAGNEPESQSGSEGREEKSDAIGDGDAEVMVNGEKGDEGVKLEEANVDGDPLAEVEMEGKDEEVDTLMADAPAQPTPDGQPQKQTDAATPVPAATETPPDTTRQMAEPTAA